MAVPERRNHGPAITPKKVLELARKSVAGNEAFDNEVSVTMNDDEARWGGAMRKVIIVSTQDADYTVTMDPNEDSDNYPGWMGCLATVQDDDSYPRHIESSELTAKGWTSTWAAIVSHQKMLVESQEFLAGWDSLEDAHAARMTKAMEEAAS